MADTNDVLTLAEGYRAINDPTTAATVADGGSGAWDTELAQLITGVSRRMDKVIGPVVNRTITEYHDGGRSFIRPNQTPLATVTTLKEGSGATVTALTAETFGASGGTYLLDQDDSYSHLCRIIRRSGGGDGTFLAGRRSVELVYVAGRAANTAAVDARIKQVASSIVGSIWKREGPKWAQSNSVLAAVEGETTSPAGFWNAVDRRIAELLEDETKAIPVA